MVSRRLVLRFALVLLAGGLAFGLYRLFALRLEAGDIYPAYSTLRADPLGTRVLSEAVGEMQGRRAERNYQPLTKLHPAEPVTLIYAGVSRHSLWEPGEIEAFEDLVRSGSRVVFAFWPDRTDDGSEKRLQEEREKREADSKKKGGSPAGTPVKKKTESDLENEQFGFKGFFSHKGVEFAVVPGKPSAAYSRPAMREASAPALEPELPWHSAFWFDSLRPGWTVLYRAEGHPVVVERAYGAGSIVLVSDSFLLSNEALHSSARATQFLAWLLGAHPLVIFDEEHLGIAERTGIATLLRRYRLHGFFVGLAMLAGLFLWKEAVPFLPPPPESEGGEAVAGRGTDEGLRTLLRRSVPPGKLMETCLAEWRSSADERQRERVEKAWRALSDNDRRPLRAWPALTEAARPRGGPPA